MLLSDIALNGFSGTAPTPVEKYAINNYLVNNDLFNLIEFVNIGMGSNIGNIQVSVVTYDEPDEAKFRRIGEEYDISNNTPIPVTLVLKQLGGAFQTDRVLERAFSQSPEAVDNWTEQQIGQKVNSIINSFTKYFLSGDSAVDSKQFDGLSVYFRNHPSQVIAEPMIVDNLSFTNALAVEQHINGAIALLKNAPTAVITTRVKGKAFLQSLEAYRNRGVNVVKVNDKNYYTFMGIPIIGVEEQYFPKSMLDIGTPFIFVYFAERDGIRVAVPMTPGVGTKGAVIDIVRPRVDNKDTGEAVFVRNGGVEICCVPIMVDPYAASVCYISEQATKQVTAITISGDDTITGDGEAKAYTASVTPSDATSKAVTWSIENGTGSATLSNKGANSVTVTAVTNGTVTLKAAATDGSGVVGTKEVTITGQA